MACNLKFTKIDGLNYPIGILDDIKIYFEHYETEEIARTKWEERVSRINYNNLFIMFTDKDGCTLNDLKEFDNLPFSNKIAFVHKPLTNIKSAFYIKGFESDNSVGILLNYRKPYSVKKYYDDFNYVKWFNTGLKN